MEQTAINKPIYDAFVDAGASEVKATLAARAVLPSAGDAATKADITGLKKDIERSESATTAAIERLEAATTADITGVKKDIERLEESTTAAIERLEAATKANIAELKVELLRWMAIMLGLAVTAIGVMVGLL